MYRRMLVPVDGSAASNKALAAALRLAKEQRAAVRIVHVVDVLPPAGLEGSAYIDFDGYRDAMLASGREVTKRAEARVRAAGVRAETRLLETTSHDVSAAVVLEAKRWRADLIAIGTHGRTGLARLFLGSVAEGVVRHAPAAVLLLRSGASNDKHRARR
jgi:nucleotide-binding universal stress UspA family protein